MSAKKGRPPIDSDRVDTRMSRQLLDRLDEWRLAQPDFPGRQEAIRRILSEKLARP